MIARVAARRFALACLPALLALSLPGTLSAGFLTTDRTVANFGFKGGAVDYRPDPRASAARTGSATSLSTRLPDIVGGSAMAVDPLGGALHLATRADAYGDLANLPFNVFGSLPAADTQQPPELLASSLKALGEDRKGRGLEALIDSAPVKGPLTSQYRGAGIYMEVYGVDEASWIAGYKDATSAIALIALEDAVANGTAPASALAVPLPGSLLLLAAGLPLLIRRRGVR